MLPSTRSRLCLGATGLLALGLWLAPPASSAEDLESRTRSTADGAAPEDLVDEDGAEARESGDESRARRQPFFRFGRPPGYPGPGYRSRRHDIPNSGRFHFRGFRDRGFLEKRDRHLEEQRRLEPERETQADDEPRSSAGEDGPAEPDTLS